MSERVSCAIDCDFGFWPTSIIVATAARTDQLTTPTDLEFRVKTAVDAWLKNTAEGQAAYRESSQDFNVGDLLQHFDEPLLVQELAEQGVTELTLSAPVQMVGWYHDERLFQEPF